MPGKPELPDLDAFLVNNRTGSCHFCTLPDELRSQIDAKYEAGYHSWMAFSRWLAACGHPEMTRARIMNHYDYREVHEAKR